MTIGPLIDLLVLAAAGALIILLALDLRNYLQKRKQKKETDNET